MTYKSSLHQLLSVENKHITFDEKFILLSVKLKGTIYLQIAGTLTDTSLG